MDCLFNVLQLTDVFFSIFCSYSRFEPFNSFLLFEKHSHIVYDYSGKNVLCYHKNRAVFFPGTESTKLLWCISGLPTSSQELKLLGSSGWCMKPNIRQVPFLACDCTLIYIVHRYILYTFVPYHTIFYKFQTNWDYNITFLDEIAGQADHEKGSYTQNKCTN